MCHAFILHGLSISQLLFDDADRQDFFQASLVVGLQNSSMFSVISPSLWGQDNYLVDQQLGLCKQVRDDQDSGKTLGLFPTCLIV